MQETTCDPCPSPSATVHRSPAADPTAETPPDRRPPGAGRIRRVFFVLGAAALWTGLAAALPTGSLAAQDTGAQGAASTDPRLPEGRRAMTAERLVEGESITLDGILDEGVWARAVPATDFIQQDPVFAGTPTERTEVRIVFDRETLYMGVTNYDSEPHLMLGNTMKRDEFLSSDDRFMWTMDPFFDQQSGYFFEMNPWGLMADALMGSGGGNERAWDGIWDAQVRRSEIGWVIEIAIPFRTLNFDPDAPAWGINFQRTVRRKNEENLWTSHERNQGLRRMSSAGLLLGIRDVSQGHGLDIKPYFATVTSDAPGRFPSDPRVTDTNVGLDLFYNITPSLKGNLTVNTDFAQTEVDQRLVNLTRFPLRFPEKRDFFLDGANFLSFGSDGVQPFFSRRIGLGSGGAPQPIDAGVKLTGQAGAQDVGFLHVRTGEADGVLGEDFSVLRVRRRVLAQSYVGSFFSRRHTRSEPGIDDQYTAGADIRLASSTFRGSQNLEMSGFLLWNSVPTTVDGENLAFGGRLDYPNDPWSAGIGFTEIQANHEPAIGFTPRNDYRSYTPQIGFSPRPQNHPWIRQLGFGANVEVITNTANTLLTRTVDLKPLEVQMHSQESVQLHVVPTYERLERDFEISEGVVLPAGTDYQFTRWRVQAGTANRRVVALNSNFETGGFFSGNRDELGFDVALRPRPGVRLNLQNEWNWVDLPQGTFNTRVHRLVADTQFSPWMYVVNNLQYDSVSESLGWQVRFRWTVQPGNDLYLVYTHNWLEGSRLDPAQSGLSTLDRRGAAKFVYTYRW